nr:MAG: hypothetical protein DIU78_12400 [Pseudomonadota bacterium]
MDARLDVRARSSAFEKLGAKGFSSKSPRVSFASLHLLREHPNALSRLERRATTAMASAESAWRQRGRNRRPS